MVTGPGWACWRDGSGSTRGSVEVGFVFEVPWGRGRAVTGGWLAGTKDSALTTDEMLSFHECTSRTVVWLLEVSDDKVERGRGMNSTSSEKPTRALGGASPLARRGRRAMGGLAGTSPSAVMAARPSTVASMGRGRTFSVGLVGALPA